jgi:hypothetical protein
MKSELAKRLQALEASHTRQAENPTIILLTCPNVEPQAIARGDGARLERLPDESMADLLARAEACRLDPVEVWGMA